MSKGKRVSLIMHILLSPIRILGMAPKLYTKSMLGCAGGFGYNAGAGGAMGYNLSDLPRSYTVSSCRLNEKEEEYKALLVMALERKGSSGINLDLFRVSSTRGLGGMGIRSYSVGIGKIGKIDEERPCSFRVDDVVIKSGAIPRSRSNALVSCK